MTSTRHEARRGDREFTGWHMLAVVCAFFGVTIVANIVMALAATGTFPGLVVENSYVASQHYDELIAKSRAQDRQGWRHRLAVEGSVLRFSLSRADGEPLRDINVIAHVGRPSNTAEDRLVDFAPTADGSLRNHRANRARTLGSRPASRAWGDSLPPLAGSIHQASGATIMICCGGAAAVNLDSASSITRSGRVDPTFVRETAPDRAHIDFLVPEMHCAGCLSKIERTLAAQTGVSAARANLTSHRVGVEFDATAGSPDAMLSAIEGLGYTARPFDAAVLDAAESDKTGKELLRAMAVAGFAAGNIMLLSVSVWSGASDATRDLFHWISALIALPAIAYAGRPFFRSAWRALSAAA